MINSEINNYTNFTDIAEAIDSYYSVYYNKKTHTIKMSDFFISKMDHYLWLRMHYTFYRDDFGVKISSHSFFSILNSLLSHHTNLPNPTPPDINTRSIPHTSKYYIFSGHDNSLVAILSGLGLKTESFPSYASSIIIELHKENGKYFIKFLYNDREIRVGNLWNYYTYEWNPVLVMEFLKGRMLEKGYGEVWEEERLKEIEEKREEERNFWILVEVLGFVFIVVWFVVGWCWWSYKKRRPKTGREILEQEMERFDREIQFESHRPEAF